MTRPALGAMVLSAMLATPTTGCYLGHGRKAHRAAHGINGAMIVTGAALLVVAPHDPEHDVGPDKTPFHAALVVGGLLGILYNVIDR